MKREISLKKAEAGDYVIYLDENGLPSPRFMQVDTQSLLNANKSIKMGRMCLAIPIVGFRQSLSGGLQGEIERDILESENVELMDFRVSSMPETGVPGGLRRVLTSIIDFSIEKPTEDPANPSTKKIGLAFKLHRGSYATVLLREFLKPLDIVKAGF
jgi:tRNA pseudouridine13 synthase